MPLKTFNIYKIIQATAYFQERCDCTNYMKLLKMMFFADRHILRHHGIFLTFDNYVALKDGPVCSFTKDMYTLNKYIINEINLEQDEFKYIKEKVDILEQYEIDVKEKDKSLLSIADKNALDFSLEHFGKFTQYELRDITHDYPEWKRYKSLFDRRLTNQETIITADFFNDPDVSKSPHINKYLNGVDPFRDDPLYLKAMKQDFQISYC